MSEAPEGAPGRAGLLSARREELLLRSRDLRTKLGAETAAIGSRLQWTRGIATLASAGPVRFALILGAVFVGIGRPRWLWRLARRGVLLYPAVRPILPLLARWWRSRRPPGEVTPSPPL